MRPSTDSFVVIPLVLCLLGSIVESGSGFVPDGSDQEDQVAVGVARVDITPDEPIRLSGYGGRTTESEGVRQRLWAKAMAIGGGEGESVVWVTVDLIGISRKMRDDVADRIRRRTGLSESRLAISSTHTHTGPEVGLLLNHFGEPLPPEHLATIDRYTDELERKLERVVVDALADREPARIGWGQGQATFAVNRRVIEDGRWTGFGVVSSGPVDYDLPMLAAWTPNGDLKAVLLSYACHNTTLSGDFNFVHGDWAGAAQAEIESRHPGAVAMVALGAGGDINPEPRGAGLPPVRNHGSEVANVVDSLLQSDLTSLHAPPSTRLERIELPYADLPSQSEWVEQAHESGRVGHHAHRVLDQLARGHEVPTTLNYPVQTWTFGEDLGVVFLAGEVVVDYSLRLKRELDADRLWVNAYTNGVPCYIASERVIREGGYEVTGSMPSYDRPARLSVEVEDQIVETVGRMLPSSYHSSR